ncbi:MAG TPA: 50S ribosomal protein L23 [Candidatus Obscuribacterales bacterium]|jgi:large subunit ribosomal protein L23
MDSRQANVIIRPIINEKTTSLIELGKYTFEVAKDANKIEIARALTQLIKELYPKNKTTIVDVNTLPIRGRIRRSKRHGRAPRDSKKAIVTIEGDPLEFFTA